jgi:hypothetical protein
VISPEPCPVCQHTQAAIERREPRPYGQYFRLKCCACRHVWTYRKHKEGCPPPREIQQCPECKSKETKTIESRPTEYGRRQRIECKSCQHRWTNIIGVKARPRARKRRDGERLTNDEIRLILTSDGSNQYVGQIINVLVKTVDDVRMGRIHADKLPELPRRNKKSPKLSCLDCRFWDYECIRPCRLGWPDPETYGTKYANECDDYATR